MVTLLMRLNRALRERNPARVVSFIRYPAMDFVHRRLLFNDTGNAPAPKTPGRKPRKICTQVIFYAANLSAKNIIICP